MKPLQTVAIFATIGGFLFGFDTGVVSGVAIFWVDDPSLRLSEGQVETAVSITVLAAALGAIASGAPLQRFGRRPVITVASILYMVGSLTLAAAINFGVIIVGRLILGLAVGLSSMAIPVYLAEAAPPKVRGRIVSTYTLAIVTGQAVACAVNVMCHSLFSEGMKWRVSVGVGAIPAIVQLVALFCGLLPESPRWLASVGRLEEAEAVRDRLDPGGASNWEEALAEASCGALVRETCASAPLRRIFRLGIGLQCLQQFAGINALMYYGAQVLVMCGFPKSQSLELTGLLTIAQVTLHRTLLMIFMYSRHILLRNFARA